METANLDILQKSLIFWERLSEDEKKLLLENTAEVSYSAGENIHSGNEDCIGLLLVKTGQLRAYILSEDGKEFTLFRLGPGGVCALSASCLLKSITFDTYVDADTDCQLLLVNSIALARLQNKNVYVENFALKTVTEKFSLVINALEKMLFQNLDERVAGFLLEEADRLQSNSIQLTHEQIAKYMGTAREVISRTLKQFEKNGDVKLHRGGLEIVDKQRLHRYIA